MAAAWKLEDGLKLIRAIQTKVKTYGYHVALGGGVLNHGSSQKDLDLYFLRMNNSKIKENPDGLLRWLQEMWGKAYPIGLDYEDPAPLKIGGPPVDPPAPKAKKVPIRWQDVQVRMDDVGRIVAADVAVAAPSAFTSPYKFKVKFVRLGGDRIDVFIA